MPTELTGSPSRGSTGLVDVLDRVLDKGLVVAGDVKVSIADVELLTIRIRLLICSIDKAEAIGLDWWKYDRHLSPGREQMVQENLELRQQLRLLERRLAAADARRFGSSPARIGADTGLIRCAGRRDSKELPRWPLNVHQAGQVLSTSSTECLTRGSSSTPGSRVSVVGIDLITVEARVVVASIDTYLEVFGIGWRGPPPHRVRRSSRPRDMTSSRRRTWRCGHSSRAVRRRAPARPRRAGGRDSKKRNNSTGPGLEAQGAMAFASYPWNSGLWASGVCLVPCISSPCAR